MECLTFEVKSIQAFIFASGRLRDVIGASELIDLLTNEQAQDNLLDDVLVASQAHGHIEFSRRAGGAFYAFSRTAEPLDRFARLWTLAVQQQAPGLEFVLGRGTGATYLEAFNCAQRGARARSSRERGTYPLASPIAQRSRRTGRAAVVHDTKDGGIDATVRAIKAFADVSRAGFIHRYTPEDTNLSWRDWPRNLDANAPDDESFPFQGEDRLIAVIHADGNGMGKVLVQMNEAVRRHPDAFLRTYQTFSKAIENSTRYAAQCATRDVLLPSRKDGELLAARPILLGGDDVIVIVRADLAVAYVQAFAAAFEQESERQLAVLTRCGVTGLPDRMTMGFGVVFVAANHPFAATAELAKSTMDSAKSRAKQSMGGDSKSPSIAPSSVALLRLTSSMTGDYDELVDRSSTGEGSLRYVHTLGTYTIAGSHADRLPRLSDLLQLVDLLGTEGMARGPLRGLLNLLDLDPPQARIGWRRWRQRMKETRQDALTNLDACLKRLMPGFDPAVTDLPYAQPGNVEGAMVSPLGDALDLLAVKCAAPVPIEATEVSR